MLFYTQSENICWCRTQILTNWSQFRPWPFHYICQTIPRHVLEGTYGINIIRPREDEDPDRHPTSEELLMAYGCKIYFYGKKTNQIWTVSQKTLSSFIYLWCLVTVVYDCFPHLQTWGDSWRLTASLISPDRPATSWRITSVYVQTKSTIQSKCCLATVALLRFHRSYSLLGPVLV